MHGVHSFAELVAEGASLVRCGLSQFFGFAGDPRAGRRATCGCKEERADASDDDTGAEKGEFCRPFAMASREPQGPKEVVELERRDRVRDLGACDGCTNREQRGFGVLHGYRPRCGVPLTTMQVTDRVSSSPLVWSVQGGVACSTKFRQQDPRPSLHSPFAKSSKA